MGEGKLRIWGKDLSGSLTPQRRCRFCKEGAQKISFKNAQQLQSYTTERGKILPRKISGNCAKHQKAVALAIKRARFLAILPFVVKR